jgi:peptidyl-prolyl cis-trans isomerase D
VSIEALAQDVEPPGQEIETAYEARKDSYSQPATRTIDQLPLTEGQARAQAERVRSGETGFEALAGELGEDPADLSLGTVRRDDLPEKVAEAVFAETEPGIVGPVEAPAGPVLVRIREVQRGGTVPLEAVRGEIAAALKREEAQAEAPEIARRIEELRAQGRTLPEIAGELGLPLVPFEGIARDGTLADGSDATGLLARQGFLDEAFAALDHEEREILPTERGGYFVVLVERIEESRIPPLEDVRAEVVEAWKQAERRDALLAEAQTMAEALSGTRTLEEKAAELDLAVTTHEPFPRQAAPRALPPGLVETLFAADEGAAATAPARDGAGVVLAEVTEIVEPEPERISEMAGQVRDRFDRTLAEDQMTLFVEALRANYEVTVNQDAIDAVFARIGAARDTGG